MRQSEEKIAFLRQLPIIDAHQHYWDLQGPISYPWLQHAPWLDFRYGDYSEIRKTFLPADYYRMSMLHNIVKTVHMEAEAAPGSACDEIDWLRTLGPKAPSAAIAQIWLDAPDINQQLERLAQRPLVRAVRQKPVTRSQVEAMQGQNSSMESQAWRDGYAKLQDYGFHFELQAPVWHLDEACRLACDFPKTRIALNHCGLPADRSDEGLSAWHQALEGLSQYENVCIKLSGIGLGQDQWPAELNARIIRDAISIFGSDRALFASNFPVDSLCVDFDTMYSTYKSAVSHYPAQDIQNLFNGTAAKLYRI